MDAPGKQSPASDPPDGTGSGNAGGRDPRYIWLAVAALIFAVATWLALTQAPRPDLFQPVQTLSPDWWRYPVERNAFKRLPAISGNLNGVHAARDGKRLWAVGDEGLIVHSADGGRTWARQTWVLTRPPPADGKASARPYAPPQEQGPPPANAPARKAAPKAQNELPGVPSLIPKAHAAIEALPVQQQAPQTNSTTQSLAAGANASATASADLTEVAVPYLNAVFFLPDASTGWAVGSGGTILHTTDAGQTWSGGEQPGAKPFVTYSRYPAPWWYLALLTGCESLGMALRPPRPKVRPVASVADLALSDRPLESGDRDALDFRPIALGLSNFLRNTATEPPLTLAITGDWGSGKSSLMNLPRDDLRSRGFRPVWFNAWHQPKDTNLLAALASAIRSQSLPPPLSLAGLRFRWRLAWVRTRERPVRTAFMVFLAAWLVTYFGMKPAHLTAAIEWLPHFAGAFADKDGKGTENLLGQFKSFAALVAVLGPLLTAWRGLTAFGVNPGTLAASVTGSLKQASAQSRFLNDYARQFQDVANALRPRTLTIFIDDLDRCPPAGRARPWKR